MEMEYFLQNIAKNCVNWIKLTTLTLSQLKMDKATMIPLSNAVKSLPILYHLDISDNGLKS